MRTFELLNYNIYLLENEQDCNIEIPKDSILYMGFDTETDTPIDMAKKDSNLINIMHDKPFLIQFGFNDSVYVADIENKTESFKEAVLKLFDNLCKKSNLVLGHNIKFDINMLMNLGYEFDDKCNLCDTMAIARLSLDSRSEREGGYPMGLKPLAGRLLGREYVNASRLIDSDLQNIWSNKLKTLANLLKPYKITRATINSILKDPTSTLEYFSHDVQAIWNNWEAHSYLSYKDINRELLYKYGAVDVIIVLELTKLLLPIVYDKKQMEILKREMALIMPLVRMERTGYTVDKNYLLKSKQALIFEINTITERNRQIAGVNLSPNQHAAIKQMLKDKYNYDLESTDKNFIHVAIQKDRSMPDIVKEYLDNVIYLRTLNKWIVTYINPILFKLNRSNDDKVYTMYNPNGAVSGRFTSNFQQFPKNGINSRIGNFELFHPRKMFITGKNYPELAYIDYSQVELRLQAEYTYYCTQGTGDVNMLRAYMPFNCHKNGDKYFHNEDNEEWQGVDLHTQSTQMAFPDVEVGSSEFKKLRSIGKRVNFALIYGSGLNTVQSTLADTDPEIVAKLYNGFHNRFKGVQVYSRWVHNKWFENNGYVTNLLGRRYYNSDPNSVYKLNNYLIQGSAADIIKLCIIQVDKMLRTNHYKTRLQGCIHDELCICVAEGEHDVIYKIQKIMENTVKTYVPLVAEIEVTTTNWAEKHEEVE